MEIVNTSTPKPFVVYCPYLNEVALCENPYGVDQQLAMMLLNLGRKYRYEYIGEF